MEKCDFIAPAGWQWEIPNEEQGWKIKLELSVAVEPNEGHSEWEQEVFEYQSRETFQNWPHQITESTWFDSVFKFNSQVLSWYFDMCCFFRFVFSILV